MREWVDEGFVVVVVLEVVMEMRGRAAEEVRWSSRAGEGERLSTLKPM